MISIHALREEGDACHQCHLLLYFLFLSTPSARRATKARPAVHADHLISIHALREEGDRRQGTLSFESDISIHALREEGDVVVPSEP